MTATNSSHSAESPDSTDERFWPGGRFGAQEQGPGAVASTGRRVVAFLIDIALSAMLAWAITWPDSPENLSLAIWAGVTILTVAVFGMSPGHAAMRIRVASVRGAALVGLWAIPRTVLIFLIVPPLITDADGRGLHDRLCRTIVLRVR